MSADARPAVVALGLPGHCTVPRLAWSAPRPKTAKGNAYSSVCQHCSLRKVQRPRGLCWPCFYTPGVRELYPPTSKYARRGVAHGYGRGPLPPEPTTAAPGTPAKVAVLEECARLKQSLWHPHDATGL